MANSYPFNVVYDLPEIQFIAGANQEFTFYVFTSASVPVSLSGATVEWDLYYYGQRIPTLTKTGITSGSSNYFNVYLTGADTENLPPNKYTHKYIVTDTSGSVYKPSQGIINIL
jgi:hypothetical protein